MYKLPFESARSELESVPFSSCAVNVAQSHDTIRYDTRCYFNVRSKANISQLNLPHGSAPITSLKKGTREMQRGGRVVRWRNGRASDLRSRGREFDPRPGAAA